MLKNLKELEATQNEVLDENQKVFKPIVDSIKNNTFDDDVLKVSFLALYSYENSVEKLFSAIHNNPDFKVSEFNISSNLLSFKNNVFSGSWLKYLKKIDLSHNHIEKFNYSNETFEMLEEIDLNNNFLKMFDCEGWTKLKRLDLSKNYDLVLKNVHYMISLEDLKIENSKLKTFDAKNLKNLKNLELRNNKLYEVTNINDLTSVENIHLENNKLESLDVDGLKSLKLLWLCTNKITSLSVQNVPQFEDLNVFWNRLKKSEIGKLLYTILREQSFGNRYDSDFVPSEIKLSEENFSKLIVEHMQKIINYETNKQTMKLINMFKNLLILDQISHPYFTLSKNVSAPLPLEILIEIVVNSLRSNLIWRLRKENSVLTKMILWLLPEYNTLVAKSISKVNGYQYRIKDCLIDYNDLLAEHLTKVAQRLNFLACSQENIFSKAVQRLIAINNDNLFLKNYCKTRDTDSINIGKENMIVNEFSDELLMQNIFTDQGSMLKSELKRFANIKERWEEEYNKIHASNNTDTEPQGLRNEINWAKEKIAQLEEIYGQWLISIVAYKKVVYVFLELKSAYDIMESNKYKNVLLNEKENIFKEKYQSLRPFIRENLNAPLLKMISQAIGLYGDIHKNIGNVDALIKFWKGITKSSLEFNFLQMMNMEPNTLEQNDELNREYNPEQNPEQNPEPNGDGNRNNGKNI